MEPSRVCAPITTCQSAVAKLHQGQKQAAPANCSPLPGSSRARNRCGESLLLPPSTLAERPAACVHGKELRFRIGVRHRFTPRRNPNLAARAHLGLLFLCYKSLLCRRVTLPPVWASTGTHCGAKLECRTVSPTLMPSRSAVPPFNSSTANSGPGGPMMSSDSGVARAAM